MHAHVDIKYRMKDYLAIFLDVLDSFLESGYWRKFIESRQIPKWSFLCQNSLKINKVLSIFRLKSFARKVNIFAIFNFTWHPTEFSS